MTKRREARDRAADDAELSERREDGDGSQGELPCLTSAEGGRNYAYCPARLAEHGGARQPSRRQGGTKDRQVMMALVFLYMFASIFIFGGELNAAILQAKRKRDGNMALSRC
jgi:hypothetical protein